jgi:SRSO17 transposase
MPSLTGRCICRKIERAIAAGVPFRWVVADTVYGVSEIERALRQAGKGYVLGVAATARFHSWGKQPAVGGTAETIVQGLEAKAWTRLSAGAGTKGERLYDWAYLELANLAAEEYGSTGLWTRGLLIRRNLVEGMCAYFTTWCPAGTTLETLAAVEGERWTIEDSFETAKNELGLDHNESRSWHGWHRHVSLDMLAIAMMATIRHHANQPAPQKTPPRLPRLPQHSSAGPSRKSAASPPASHSAASARPTSSPGRFGAERTKPPPNAHT